MPPLRGLRTGSWTVSTYLGRMRVVMSQFASPSPKLVPSYKWLRVLFSKVITTLQRSKMLHFSFCFYADVAFLSAAARRASDSVSVSITAHSVLEVPRGRGENGRRGAAAPAAPPAVGTRRSARLIGKPQRSHSRKLPTLRVMGG